MTSHSFSYSTITNPEYSVLLSILHPSESILRVENIVGPASASFDGSHVDGRILVYNLAALVPNSPPTKDRDAVEVEQWISHAFSEQCESFLKNHTETDSILHLLNINLGIVCICWHQHPTVVDAIWFARLSPRLFNMSTIQGNEFYRVVRWAKHLAEIWNIGKGDMTKLVERSAATQQSCAGSSLFCK